MIENYMGGIFTGIGNLDTVESLSGLLSDNATGGHGEFI